FPVAEAAEGAGFRSCRRCRPREASPRDREAARVRTVCRRIEASADSTLSLKALSAEVGWGPHHLQRTFKRIVGVSPRQYADAVRLRSLRERLRKGDPVTTAIYDAGYGSSSRVYERAPTRLGMTPATYRRGGRGVRLAYAIAPSPLGRLLVAASERGVSAVRLGDSEAGLVDALRAEFPAAEIDRDDAGVGAWLKAVLQRIEGGPPHGLPAARVGRPARHPLRRGPVLRRRGPLHRPAYRRARLGPRLRHEPGGGDHPLPPRRPGQRRNGRLPLGRRAQARAARAREGPGPVRPGADAPVLAESSAPGRIRKS